MGSTPNYYPSSFYNLSPTPQYAEPDQEQFAGTVTDYESPIVLGDYAQATVFWQDVLPKEPGIDGQQTFVDNVSGHLRAVTGDKSDEIKKAVYGKSPRRCLIAYQKWLTLRRCRNVCKGQS